MPGGSGADAGSSSAAPRQRSKSFARRMSATIFFSAKKDSRDELAPPPSQGDKRGGGGPQVSATEGLPELKEGQAVWYDDDSLGWILCQVVGVPAGGVGSGEDYVIFAPDLQEDEFAVERWELHPARAAWSSNANSGPVGGAPDEGDEQLMDSALDERKRA